MEQKLKNNSNKQKIMRKTTKQLFFAALALTTLGSCTDETFTGDQSLKGGTGAISFSMNTPAMTRATETGATAAGHLSNRFIVWGEKNETDGTAASASNLVFENYKVEYTANTAYTSTSNTQNWEYVGLTPYISTKVSPAITGTQTIKYWDFGADSYTFTAVSALDADIDGGLVKIEKIQSGADVYAKGYHIYLAENAHLDNVYVADRNQPVKGTGTDRNAQNTYGGNVTMSFRHFLSKIRFGIYENIPGYKVKITNVDYHSTTSTSTSKFGVDGKFLVPGTNTAYTITYYSANNKPKAAIKAETTPNSVTYLETAQTIAGCPILHTAPTEIATSPASPTWDKTDGAFTTVLPFPSNDTSMKIKLDFTLTSEDTGETINVVDATAEIPATYCQWLPNYAYTYILKLNDNTNGQIGGVTGLYPITFDALEITDDNGEAEYITTISEPSITTIGVKGSAYSTGLSDYAAATDVYATVMDGSSLATLEKSANIWLYTVTGTGITEAAVAERLIEAPTMNAAQITTANAKTNPTDVTTDNLTIQNTVPMEDNVSNNKTIGTNKVGKFTTASGTTYALVYQKEGEGPTYVWGTGNKYDDLTAFNAAVTALGSLDNALYTDDKCTVKATWENASTDYFTINASTYADASKFADAGIVYTRTGEGTVGNPYVYTVASSFGDSSTVYYKPIKVKSKGTVVVKVVTCP